MEINSVKSAEHRFVSTLQLPLLSRKKTVPPVASPVPAGFCDLKSRALSDVAVIPRKVSIGVR